jgi:hypothetical protein
MCLAASRFRSGLPVVAALVLALAACNTGAPEGRCADENLIGEMESIWAISSLQGNVYMPPQAWNLMEARCAEF